jgi:hypothetical protein
MIRVFELAHEPMKKGVDNDGAACPTGNRLNRVESAGAYSRLPWWVMSERNQEKLGPTKPSISGNEEERSCLCTLVFAIITSQLA